MIRKSIAGILSLVLMITVFPGFTFAENNLTAGGNVILANNGSALYQVFVHSDADSMEQHAAEELTDYLTQVTGAPFQLTADTAPPNDPVVLVGRNALTESLVPELAGNTLGDDGFVIRKINQNIIIAGSHSRGTMYGVNYFLDNYVGVKWFAPEYTYVPDTSILEVTVDDDIQIPRFEYREMYVSDGNNEQYRAHNLLNGKYADRYNHVPQSEPGLNSWSQYWPDEVHNFYSIVPQTQYHNGRQLLAMDENVRQIAADKLIDKINQRISEGKDASYGFSQEDDIWIPDPASQAFADQHGGSLAAPTFDLLNDVAQRVSAVIPGARIGTLAYMFSLEAPTNMAIEDNIVITFAPIFKDHGRAINSTQNQFYKDNIDKWAAISDNLILWDYLTDYNGGGYLMPYPVLNAMGQTLQYIAQFPAFKGYFGQQMQNIYAPGETGFAYLRAWVAAKLLWNPNQDYQQLINEFVQGYYGDAAPYISSYLNSLEQAYAQSDSVLTISTPITSSFLNFDLMYQADGLFEQAAAAVAGNPLFLDHVQKARVEVDYVTLMRRVEFMKEAEDRNITWNYDFENRFDRFKANTANVVDYKANTNIELLYEWIEVGRTVPTIPDFVQSLPASDWVDFQDNAMRLHTPVGTKIVQDAKASDNAAVRVTGNTNTWAIQIPDTTLPRTGKWKLYANVRIDPGTGSPSDKAFDFGIYPPMEDTAWKDYAEFADGEYHFVEFPWVYEYDSAIDDHLVWLAPPNSNAIEYLYVDRIIAVRQVPPDKTALESLITLAQARLTDTTEGDDPGQYPAAARTLLQAAITAAASVASDAEAKALQVTEATSDLQAAVDAYDAAEVPEADKTALLALIASAQSRLTATVEGSAAGQFPANARTSLLNAITAAQTIADNTNALQGVVDAEVSTLQNALSTYNSAEIQPSSPGPNSYTYVSQSDNVDLKELTVVIDDKPFELTPAFTTKTTSYKLETEAAELELRSKASHSLAKIIITKQGKLIDTSTKLSLQEGDNVFEIGVKAENGATRTYTLTIHRKKLATKPDPDKPVVQPDPSVVSLSDLAGHWAEADIQEALAQKLISGYPDHTFRPDQATTRAEFIVMLIHALKPDSDGSSKPLSFTDRAKIGAWAEQEVAQAVALGLVAGYEDGSFRPDAYITRAEIATTIAKALSLSLNVNVNGEAGFSEEFAEGSAEKFTDDKDIPVWARTAVEALRKQGMISGREGNRFEPHAKATRAESVALLLRVLKTVE
ncbi:DUF4838 domain-containing protein [Paenibacillus eucommiae]|uniref:SLH domain-containing protein n=1 Tax=Paenibacillus eucommiae TaxID=1355755 RepID=A0ABS4IVT6_9BACL|nr:DUF4838 domain-containing protein [Paenibacillus eucommiae]MBP1991703.1 hypothetical protein [Paenibacillus eucommiae]